MDHIILVETTQFLVKVDFKFRKPMLKSLSAYIKKKNEDITKLLGINYKFQLLL